MNLKDIMEEIIENLPDNCSAEYFTDDGESWYLENDVINYLRSYAEQYQELAEAKKRMAELDEKINKLYESTLSGLLPERQAQRMIQQYDEEQILLERRVAELENLVQQDEIKGIQRHLPPNL